MSVSHKTYQHSGNSEVIRWVTATDQRILDLGCGAGDNARLLATEHRTIDGVTMSLNEADLAKKWMRKVVVYNLEAGLPAELSGPYDLAVASHVLEHICFPEILLRHVHAALSPEGRFVVALPNLLVLSNRLRLLFGRFDYESGGIMDDTHFRWYTFESARRLLEASGFAIIEAYGDGHLPMKPLRRFLPKGFISAIDKLVCRFFPGLFGSQLIFVATPKKN
jgi:2-polyprenyl-3-methyl-5-hydroxy-6-metoxy-1,4-benzoquinol methylase